MKKILKRFNEAPKYLIGAFLTISVLTGFIIGFFEFAHFERVKSETVLGLNEVWQLNMFSHSKINLTEYNSATQAAYHDLESFLGYNSSPGLKGFFDGFVNSASSLDKNSLCNDTLLVDSSKKFTAYWSVRNDVSYATNQINYNLGQIIGKKGAKADVINKIVFSNFVEYLKENLPDLRDPSKINLKDHPTEFKRYNQTIIKAILGNSNADFNVLSEIIKLHRFFIASKRTDSTNKPNLGNMVVYPAHTFERFNDFNPSNRAWWNAAFNNKFPFGFEKDENGTMFGLTGMYNDVQADNNVLLQDRTFFCRFNLPLIQNYEFVACIDLFLDDSTFGTDKFIGASSNKIFGALSISSWILPISYRMGFFIDGIFSGIFLFFILFLFKDRLFNIIKNHIKRYEESDYVEFHLSRNGSRFPIPRKFDDHKASLSILQTKIDEFETSLSRSAGLSLEAINKLFSLGIKAEAKKNQSEQTSISLNYSLDITLGIDNTNIYRCIEFWNIKDKESRQVGVFIIKWLNTIFTKEEIAITIIGPLKMYEGMVQTNKIISKLKKRLEEHLLQSEDATTIIKISAIEAEEQIFEVPDPIARIELGADDLTSYFMRKGHAKRLLERRLVFQSKAKNDDEFKLFLKLYEAGVNIYAICGISFLKNLNEREKLKSFLQETVDKERIFIEAYDKEFKEFYDPLNQNIKDIFNRSNLEKFFLGRFKDPLKLATYKSYDFALAKDQNNNTQYVMFFYDNSTSNELGWVSWRQVDIEFYENVYSIIKTDLEKEVSISEVINNKRSNRSSKRKT